MKNALSVLLAWAALGALGGSAQTVISEDFSTDPLQNGWNIIGDTNLFQWNSTNQNLGVTWDSSKPNSFFYHPMGTILGRDDNFSLSFDLLLNSIGPGPDPAKTNSFPIAIGFLNLSQATQTSFYRGTGTNSPDLVEFAYFFDSGFGATVWPTVVDTNSTFNFNSASDYAVFALKPGDWYHVSLAYAASNQIMMASVTNSAHDSGVSVAQLVNTNFTDFRATVLSISSYSQAGQDPAFAGSVLAHGAIAHLLATVPLPPVQDLSGGFDQRAWRVQFNGRTNWLYTLERTSNFQAAIPVSQPTPGTNGRLVLADTNAPPGKAFYQVRAERP